MSSSHPMWSGPTNTLRKQKSCVVDAFPAARSSTVVRNGRSLTLKKQMSVDHSNQLGLGRRSDGFNGQLTMLSDGKPEASMRIFTAVKKRMQVCDGGIDTDTKPTERFKKSQNRLNLSIFLSPSQQQSQDGDCASDIENENEAISTNTQTNPDPPIALSPTTKLSPKKETPTVTAADRRHAFQSSKTIISPAAVPPTVSAPISERRPPLVRAMSAPVRTIEESTKSLQQNGKRRPIRRRKGIPYRNSTGAGVIDDFQDEIFHELGVIEDELESEKPAKSKVALNKKNAQSLLPRSRSALGGCDVVTLVSLLSSGGSDSEREDMTTKTEVSPARALSGRAPMLRKAGKSVSFQENCDVLSLAASTPLELPIMLRRGSIAPLNARLRSSRPPTAPAASIFHKDFGNRDRDLVMDKVNQNSEFDTKSVKSETDDGNKIVSDVEVFPEFCRSQKEKDCWMLFQKMSKKGIRVSYDTILRGMLTPTELRAVQKQKTLDEERLNEAAEEEAAAAAAAVQK